MTVSQRAQTEQCIRELRARRSTEAGEDRRDLDEQIAALEAVLASMNRNGGGTHDQ